MRYSALARVAAASALIAVLPTQPAWGWGAVGHSMINRLAAQYLPADVPAFMHNPAALDTMAYLGPEPDRWRQRDAEPELVAVQAPDHFIDMEWAELAATPCPSGANSTNAANSANPANPAISATSKNCVDGYDFPRERYDFIRALAVAQAKHPELKLTPESVGMQPWQVEEVWQRLKVGFREYRQLSAGQQDTKPIETAILFYAAWLGHYVGDGSQPLHTTIQYNGWTGPNPNGYTTAHHIHSLFETSYVSANVKPSDVAPLVADTQPKVIGDEWTQYLDYLNNTHALVEQVYQIDKTHGFDGAGTPEAKTFTDQRLAAGAIQLRNMIYSAWVHSGDPVQEYHGPQ